MSNLHPCSLPRLGTPLCARSSQRSTSVRAAPSSLLELHLGMNLAHCACLERAAPIASRGYRLRPILIAILVWSANSLGGKNPPVVCEHITKDAFRQRVAVISGAQLGSFNPPLSSLGLLVMQPAFTQHNGRYLPMCFEGYC